ncbi:DoxX family protein [Nocardia vinacea]|uniref:DoxX family protein n=1 Tax=Nocardia vinacea TaxID=96468 RepID=UPI003429E0DE
MDVCVLIGRIVFAILFLPAGFAHLTRGKGMVELVKAKGLPMPAVAVYSSGVCLLTGGLSVLLGVWADLGSLLLGVFLVVAAVTMHNFWAQTQAMAKQNDRIHFNKNIELAGASLMLFAFFAHTSELGLTLTGPLFSLN